MNQVILIGNLGKAANYYPDLDLAIFDIATSQFYKKDAESKEFSQSTQWHTIFCNKYLASKTKDLQKGEKVAVTGLLKYKSILDKMGNKTQTAYIQAVKIEILTPKKTSETQAPQQEQIPVEYYANDAEAPF